MCSILGILDLRSDPVALRAQALDLSRRMRHRGPDWSGVYANNRAILVHERLAIVGVDSGAQPLLSPDGTQALAVNGEIYNHRELRAATEANYAYQTHSDCEVILPLYRQFGADFLNQLEGMFAFVLWDDAAGRWLIGRDPIGIIPLYYGHDEHGNLYVGSELKSLAPVCKDAKEFPPGTIGNRAMPHPRSTTIPLGVITPPSRMVRPTASPCARPLSMQSRPT
jgi:asparagine synthase (glutamine-hydrolysing)